MATAVTLARLAAIALALPVTSTIVEPPATTHRHVSQDLLLAGPSAEVPSGAGGLEVVPLDARFYRDGSCRVRFSLLNRYTQTLRVSAEAFLVDAAGNSIGSRPTFFPPALAGKRAYTEITFYSTELATPCRPPITVRIQPVVCEVIEGGFLSDRSCRIGGERTFRPR